MQTRVVSVTPFAGICRSSGRNLTQGLPSLRASQCQAQCGAHRGADPEDTGGDSGRASWLSTASRRGPLSKVVKLSSRGPHQPRPHNRHCVSLPTPRWLHCHHHFVDVTVKTASRCFDGHFPTSESALLLMYLFIDHSHCPFCKLPMCSFTKFLNGVIILFH